jgi:lipoate-protein ligase A
VKRRTDESAFGVVPESLTAALPHRRLTHPPPHPTPWRLLVEPAGSAGAVNMAIDQDLLERAAESSIPTLRLYRWNPPCLSFGRNEPASQCYDRAQVERLGIDVVRRPTGGRAVWHEHEVTYAVAAPIDAFASLRGAYRAIHETLAAALRSLGADVVLAPDRRLTRPPLDPTAASSDRHGSCFSTSVGGEILAGGRKLVGSAQVRRGDALLQHGSILLEGSQEMLRAVGRLPSDIGGATTLSQVLGRPVTFAEVANAVVMAFADRLTAASSDRRITRPPSVPTARFLDPAWTWRR